MFVFADQFLDFTKQRALTFFDGDDSRVSHSDVSTPYCPRIRHIGTRIAQEMGIAHRPSATYVCVEGPRFETAAEIRMFAMLGGDIVGMTNVPEVVLARELGLCYALVTVVTNLAAGLDGPKVDHQGVLDRMRQAGPSLEQLLRRMVEEIDDDDCRVCRGPRQDRP
jgi:5'-methylthioadenosine phosphorylase